MRSTESNTLQSGPNSNSNRRSSLLSKAGRYLAYWFKLVAQPVVTVVFVVLLAYLFGYAQRNMGWFNDAKTSANEEQVDDTLYACSMLCVFVEAPGRCPVCGMVLQKIDVPGDPKDLFGVTIDPTARRLANIKTVPALVLPASKSLQALGRITHDETTEATISSYVNGRVVDLLVDYTGAKVTEGEALAVLYSGDLYADQLGLLNARKALQENQSSNETINAANRRLYESARRRLVEFGLSEQQIDEIERKGKADSRIRVFAPSSGTVIEKLVDDERYVQIGTPLLKIADLSNVWLMLDLFPEDTSDLKIGQAVAVAIQSQPGRKFEGQISFIDPIVDPKTQTVKVRVVIGNEAGLIKIGDFGNATIQTKTQPDSMVVVPRESVLISGSDSVAYVETRPGRFENRKVEIAKMMGDRIALASGIEPGEEVVASGTFMLDSTFNIQGKVSLIDPNRAIRRNEAQIANNEAEAKEIEESFAGLSPEDRKLAEEQIICPVSDVKLGTKGMGQPIRVVTPAGDIMICCEGCRGPVVEEPEKHLAIIQKYFQEKQASSDTSVEEPE